jgi:phosphatidate cytidylyltransferase
MAYLLVLPGQTIAAAGDGLGLLLFLMLLTQFNDVHSTSGASSFGRHKIIPTVSPNKTVEGLLGGVATTTVLAQLLAPVLTPLVTGISARSPAC